MKTFPIRVYFYLLGIYNLACEILSKLKKNLCYQYLNMFSFPCCLKNCEYLSVFKESVLVYDFWTPRPPIIFVHDHLLFSKFIIIYFFVI